MHCQSVFFSVFQIYERGRMFVSTFTKVLWPGPEGLCVGSIMLKRQADGLEERTETVQGTAKTSWPWESWPIIP